MRHNGNWYGYLVLAVGILYLLADLAQEFSMQISGWGIFFLLGGLGLIHLNKRVQEQ